MHLYFSPGSCSLAAHIVAREAGVPLDMTSVNLMTKVMGDGGHFSAINAKGYVPALALDNGELLTEVPVVLHYLADRNPGSRLAPAAGSMERYRLQEWLNFTTSELHKAMGSFFNPMQTPEWRKAVEERLSMRCAWLNQQLGNKTHLMGETFTVADAYLYTVLNWAGMVKFDLSHWPALQAFQARVSARPKVMEALRAEGLMH